VQRLVALATRGPTPERATALLALGVAGARRAASLADDGGLRAAIDAGLRDENEDVAVAAAYALFRQRVALEQTALAAAQKSSAAQARIFLARALPAQSEAAVQQLASVLLVDSDWRVRVETIRAVVARHDPSIDTLVAALVGGLSEAVKHARQPGEQHVVREACLALADVAAPAVGLAAATAALAALPEELAAARGACASAVVVLGGPGDAVDVATARWADERRRRQTVEMVSHLRVSLPEKVRALQPFLDDDVARVRVAAAGALCSLGGTAAADAAATRLVDETDPGVASALLECFASGNDAEVLRDRTIETAAARFLAASSPEASEPLVALAALARARPTLAGLVARLGENPDGRVRDVARGVPAGERAPGPRAVATSPPSPATLPLAAVLRTSRGDITIAFERELAPLATQTFVALAQQGAYRATHFHRVVANFVAQGGDPRGDGSGGPGFMIPCENSDAAFSRGAVGIATAGKDTGGSQFFLVQSAQPHLDGRYTLFARVVAGLEVVDALEQDDIVVDVEITTALRKTVRPAVF
jgi:cyclophilin family peptidyl-prolyl cis-trans isomerase